MEDIKDILKERRKTHGDFKETAAASQCLKSILHAGTRWPSMSLSQKESIEMIAHKLARVIEGNCDEPDHWQDIIGYAQLVLNNLEENK